MVAQAALLEAVARHAAEFDVIHMHIDWLHLPLLSRLGVPFLTTCHGRMDLPGFPDVIRHFPDAREFLNLLRELVYFPDRIPMAALAVARRPIDRIEVEADVARLMFRIENVPSLENPRTGRLTPLSVVALLKKLSSPLAIGT